MDVRNVIASVLPTARVAARSASASQNAQSVVRNQPSVQARQFIENISSSTSLSAVEKQGFIEAASVADKFMNNAGAKQEAFKEIASMGLYFQHSSTKEFPRWNVLTGLRYYGLNRDPDARGITEQQAQQQVKQKLETVAVNRGMDYADISARQARKPEPVRVQETAQMFGHAVRTEVKSTEVKAPEVRKVDVKA